jgi:hypothetical protein
VKRLIVPTGIALAAAAPGVAAAAIPAAHTASAKGTSAAHVSAYERAYQKAVKEFGHRAPGRNIVKDGVASGGAPSDAQVLASLAVLERMVAPAPTTSATTTSSTAPVSTAGAAGVPACASESGTNYSTGASNTNPSSGATGRYQILPSTAAAYGCSLTTPAGQDACAQTIYQHQGAGAWVGCGG